MRLKVSKVFADEGVSGVLRVAKGDAFKYTVDVSNDFDGVLYLRFTKDLQAYQLTQISSDVSDVLVENSEEGFYDFKVEYADGEVALTGTASVKLYEMDKVLHEVLDFNKQPKFQVSEAGIKVFGNQVSDGIGAVASDYVEAVEKGNEAVHQTVLNLSSLPVTVANTTGASFGSAQLYDFPAGRILILGVTANLSFDWSASDIVATGSGDFALGTSATADATLNGTEVNLLPSTGLTDPFVAGVGVGVGALAASAHFDGTATAIDAYLNLIVDDADVDDASSNEVLVSGSVTISWINLGDY